MDEDIAQRIKQVYEQAERDVLQRIRKRLQGDQDVEDAASEWEKRKLAQLRDMQKQVEQNVQESLASFNNEDMRGVMETEYKKGADKAVADLEKVAGKGSVPITDSFHRPHAKAIEALHTELQDRMLPVVDRMGGHAAEAYRECVQRGAEFALSGAGTIREGVQRTLNQFADKGISRFKDQSGRNWSLQGYAEMATRTALGDAHRTGHKNRMRDNNQELVIISAHAESCPICDPWEREILSLTGEHDKYPSLGDAEADGLFHPNCGHGYTAYIPGLTEQEKELARPGGEDYKERQQQRYLERGKRKWERRRDAALTDKERRKAEQKMDEWDQRLADFANETGRNRKYEREHIQEGDPRKAVQDYIDAPEFTDDEEPIVPAPDTDVDNPDNPLRAVSLTPEELQEERRNTTQIIDEATRDWDMRAEKVRTRLEGNSEFGEGFLKSSRGVDVMLDEYAELMDEPLEEVKEQFETGVGVTARIDDENMEQMINDMREAGVWEQAKLDASRDERARKIVEDRISEWNSTSQGRVRPDAFQKAAQEELGLEDATTEHFKQDHADLVEERLEREGAAYKAVARAQYEETQEFLEEHDIDSLTLYRGAGFYEGELPEELQHLDFGSELSSGKIPDLQTQPLNSYTAEPGITPPFANGMMKSGKTTDNAIIVAQDVPRDRIFSLANTGPGSKGEYEVVVTGGVDSADVVSYSPRDASFGSDDIVDGVARKEADYGF